MNAYSHLSCKKIAQEYKRAYSQHHEVTVMYENGQISAMALQQSAQNLKALRIAYKAEYEAEQVLQ
jgi:hypothetical protein